VKSIRGHVAAQVYTNGKGFDRIYPMKDKKGASVDHTLVSFIHDVGIPQTLVSDGAKEELLGAVNATCRRYHIQQKQTVPYSPWSNLAEASIRELKVGIRRATRRQGSPKRLWCYCAQWVAGVRRLTALDIPDLEGRVPAEVVTGSTPDITAYVQFDWYEHVFYWDPAVKFPDDRKLIGRWLGVAEVAIDELAFYILTKTGKVIIRKSVWALSEDDRHDPGIYHQIADLDASIRERLGDSVKEIDPELADSLPEVPDGIFDDDEETVTPADPSATKPDADDFTPEAYDQYLTAKVLLPQGGELQQATVIARKRDRDGKPVGKRNENPLLDTRVYEVQYPNGATAEITANLIAENIYSQVDQEGRSYSVLREIVDHRSNGHALKKDDGYEIGSNGQRRPKHTTKGWELQVEWRDGSMSWVPLKDLKESNPIEVAEYAVANKISEEPAFAWWTRHVLKKRDRMICKVKSRYWSRTSKYGIELPKTVEEAYDIDKRTGTDFWRKAIEKEMKNVFPAFEFVDDDKIPVGYQKITCHMVFDIKMDLTRKARLVANGNETNPPKESVYSSVVSRDSVRIALLVAALNDLDILSADIQNAYLNAPTKEKIYTIAGPEFGADNIGRPVLIVRALYGLRSSGARFREHLASTL
jgi:hypothetical protein